MKIREVVEVLAGYDQETVLKLVAAAKSVRDTNAALDALEPAKKKRGRKPGRKAAAPASKTPVKAVKKATPKKTGKPAGEDAEEY